MWPTVSLLQVDSEFAMEMLQHVGTERVVRVMTLVVDQEAHDLVGTHYIAPGVAASGFL